MKNREHIEKKIIDPRLYQLGESLRTKADAKKFL
jgi:hypothetical protein